MPVGKWLDMRGLDVRGARGPGSGAGAGVVATGAPRPAAAAAAAAAARAAREEKAAAAAAVANGGVPYEPWLNMARGDFAPVKARPPPRARQRRAAALAGYTLAGATRSSSVRGAVDRARVHECGPSEAGVCGWRQPAACCCTQACCLQRAPGPRVCRLRPAWRESGRPHGV